MENIHLPDSKDVLTIIQKIKENKESVNEIICNCIDSGTPAVWCSRLAGFSPLAEEELLKIWVAARLFFYDHRAVIGENGKIDTKFAVFAYQFGKGFTPQIEAFYKRHNLGPKDAEKLIMSIIHDADPSFDDDPHFK